MIPSDAQVVPTLPLESLTNSAPSVTHSTHLRHGRARRFVCIFERSRRLLFATRGLRLHHTTIRSQQTTIRTKKRSPHGAIRSNRKLLVSLAGGAEGPRLLL